jgi:NAD(P)-dependent dehydrogenase (short-subunit alcohol dehydrogenase family)
MPATYDFSGSIALVTGAAGDFGRTVALRLAASGARLVLTDLAIAAEGLEESRRQCAAIGGDAAVAVVNADVTDAASVAALFDAAAERLGVPDLVFNNAGIQGDIVPLADYSVDDFVKVISINATGIFVVLREAARRLRADGRGGAIVNSASMAGVEGAANMPAYSASKGAVMSLTRAASKDLAPLGIRVNAISPCFIGPGRMWDRQTTLQAQAASQYYSTDPAQVEREMIGAVPMRRMGSLDEVAATVVWLLSDESSYLTGQNLVISGGI